MSMRDAHAQNSMRTRKIEGEEKRVPAVVSQNGPGPIM